MGCKGHVANLHPLDLDGVRGLAIEEEIGVVANGVGCRIAPPDEERVGGLEVAAAEEAGRIDRHFTATGSDSGLIDRIAGTHEIIPYCERADEVVLPNLTIGEEGRWAGIVVEEHSLTGRQYGSALVGKGVVSCHHPVGRVDAIVIEPVDGPDTVREELHLICSGSVTGGTERSWREQLFKGPVAAHDDRIPGKVGGKRSYQGVVGGCVLKQVAVCVERQGVRGGGNHVETLALVVTGGYLYDPLACGSDGGEILQGPGGERQVKRLAVDTIDNAGEGGFPEIRVVVGAAAESKRGFRPAFRLCVGGLGWCVELCPDTDDSSPPSRPVTVSRSPMVMVSRQSPAGTTEVIMAGVISMDTQTVGSPGVAAYSSV